MQPTVMFRQPLPSNDPTVAEVIALYLQLEATPRKEAARSKKAWINVERVLGEFNRACGPLRVSECRKLNLKLFIEQNPKLKTGWAKAGQCGIIQRCFNWATDEMELTLRNPFKGVKYAKGPGRRNVTNAEYRALLPLAYREYGWVLRFSYYTACRPAELSQAKWPDYHEEEKEGVLCCWLQLAEHKTVEKTEEPRIIIVPARAREILQEIRASSPFLPGMAPDFIFLNRKGKPWTQGRLCRDWAALREKAGLPDDAKLYGLRHQFATGARSGSQKLSREGAAELLGHSGTDTIDNYDHSLPDIVHLCRQAEQAVVNLERL